jgi:tetratricopeptide (TPR) repeat protein
MRLPLLIIIFIFSTLTIFSQSKLDSLVTLGNEQSFQFNFQQAEKTFQKAITEYPHSSLGYYYISRNNLWFYLANKDSISRTNHLKYFELALSKGEHEYKNNSENAILNYNLGNIYLLKSIYNSTEHNTMDAFWATKSAVNYFEEAIDLDSNFYEPYLGLGTIKYALGFVPGFLGWAISVAGLDGEKSEGLKFILNASNKSKYSKTEAAYHLGKIYTEYNAEYEKAEYYLRNLVEKYSQNELFIYQYAILQMDKRNLAKAKEYLNKIVFDITSVQFNQTYALSLFLIGEIAFKENRFDDAIEEYKKFIINSTSLDYTGIANYKIALSYKMLNDDFRAKKYFLLARNGNKNIAEDSYAAEMSYKYYEEKFDGTRKRLILAQNFLESDKTDLALKEISKIEIIKSNTELNLKIDLIKIEIFQQKNEFHRSRKLLNKYNQFESFNDFDDYSKLLYFLAKQFFYEKDFAKSEEFFELSLDNLNKYNNKLNRLLVNLNSQLKEKNN